LSTTDMLHNNNNQYVLQPIDLNRNCPNTELRARLSSLEAANKKQPDANKLFLSALKEAEETTEKHSGTIEEQAEQIRSLLKAQGDRDQRISELESQTNALVTNMQALAASGEEDRALLDILAAKAGGREQLIAVAKEDKIKTQQLAETERLAADEKEREAVAVEKERMAAAVLLEKERVAAELQQASTVVTSVARGVRARFTCKGAAPAVPVHAMHAQQQFANNLAKLQTEVGSWAVFLGGSSPDEVIVLLDGRSKLTLSMVFGITTDLGRGVAGFTASQAGVISIDTLECGWAERFGDVNFLPPHLRRDSDSEQPPPYQAGLRVKTSVQTKLGMRITTRGHPCAGQPSAEALASFYAGMRIPNLSSLEGDLGTDAISGAKLWMRDHKITGKQAISDQTIMSSKAEIGVIANVRAQIASLLIKELAKAQVAVLTLPAFKENRAMWAAPIESNRSLVQSLINLGYLSEMRMGRGRIGEMMKALNTHRPAAIEGAGFKSK
jgi:hypothetical protein